MEITKQQYKEANTLLETELRLLKIDFQDVKKKLEEDIEKMEHIKNGLLDNCNNRAEFIRQILMIIKGEAQPLSKYEVIRDMFSPQLNKEEQDHPSPIFIQTPFLSDKVRAEDLTYF